MAISHINTECKRYGCFKNLLACYANCRYNTRCQELRNEISDKTEEAASDINSYLAERGAAPITIQFPKRGLKFVAAAKPQPAQSKAAVIPIRAPAQSGERRKLDVDVKPQASKRAKKKLKLIKGTAARPVKSPVAVSKVKSKSPPATLKAVPQKAKKARKVKKASAPPVAALQTKSQPKRRKPMMSRTKQAQSVIANVEETKSATPEPAIAPPAAEEPKKAARNRKKNSGSIGAQNGQGKQLYIILRGNRATVTDELGLMRHVLQNPASDARYFKAVEVEARVQIVDKK
ncbi:MAG TPA: hypothetical protein VNO70_22325 [Blastocatellia bacterium]|nr:hypothetical protein [Blastocatellia bacterium]